jgi:hypothetical protein
VVHVEAGASDGRGDQPLLVSKRRELALPVAGAVVPGVGAAAGVGHHDGITGVEVVEEPFRVGRADVDAAMTDVAPQWSTAVNAASRPVTTRMPLPHKSPKFSKACHQVADL